MAEDSELWDVICDGSFVPTKNLGDPPVAFLKTRKEFNDTDRKAIEKNFYVKKILVLDQMNTTGYQHVKQSKIDMLTTEYELFRMQDNESVQEMHTQFTSIINELHSLGKTIARNKLVRKILSMLPSSWESKVNAITEAKDLQELTINELVGNPKTYEMKKKKDSERREPNKENNLVLKTENNESSCEDGDMTYLTRRFQKIVCRNVGIPKRESYSKPKNYDLFHKCGKPGHFMKDFPLLKQYQYKNNSDKAAKRNLVHDRCFNRKNVADNIVRQALAAWGDSSSESGKYDEPGNNSMMAVESESIEYDSIFALMAQSDDEDNDDYEVNFLDVQGNLKSYSPKKLMSLANVLIDTYHSLVNDIDVLTVELGEVEQSRDNLVIVAVDLRESIKNLKKERNVLKKRIENVEQERDDLLVVVMDLKETIGKPTMESRDENYQKGKEVASEAHIKLEK
uniref:Uncharacterized protein n=1 Tax=Nicotiana tabacum TaxID=4097 RepID=A0A1S4BTP2_TOBAC|nr:PREDICTED: uncharacterized protein LOC107811770 [Nicotiana tabacum]